MPANLELMEFEHETPPRALGGRSGAPASRCFFDRVARALESVEDRYD